MPRSKHFIGKAKADRLIENMKAAKKPKRNPYAALPFAFKLPVEDVRTLMNTKEAVHLVVQFGLKIAKVKGEEVKTVAPVLCVVNKDNEIIQAPKETALKMRSAGGEDPQDGGDDGDGGGYLDEVQNWP